MSRIGKKPIKIPEGVEVKIEGQRIIVKGPRGELQRELRPEIKVEQKEGQVFLSPNIETKKTRALWGLSRALVANMIEGVSRGYEKKLELHGVGFRAALEGGGLNLGVGFSHPVKITPPEGITFAVEKNVVTVSGIDKELVGNTAAAIRKVRKPEPYKGKGIRYVGEQVRRKAGKKAATIA